MNKRKRIYGIIKLIIFLLIAFICFTYLNNILYRKNATKKMADFFEQEEDFDILFFGSSHMSNTVLPILLWKNNGMISYNMGSSAETIAVSYHNMILALQETNPKLIVIDAYSIKEERKIAENRMYLHDTIDNYPFSYNKYLAIKDLFGEKDLLNNSFEYLFGFSMYHSRWSEIAEEDFQMRRKTEKGANIKLEIATPNKMSEFHSIDSYIGEENVNMQYLRKIIEYCQNNNIEVLVTYFPYPAIDEYIAFSKYVANICKEYNVNYLNFLENNIVNFETDCHDADSHLNISGAKKITRYLGEYIQKSYNIPDQRENKKYSFWKEDYQEYVGTKIERLKAENKLDRYLLLLYEEEDIEYEIIMSSEIKSESNIKIQKLLKNIDHNYKIDNEIFKNKKDKIARIITRDKQTGKQIVEKWF